MNEYKKWKRENGVLRKRRDSQILLSSSSSSSIEIEEKASVVNNRGRIKEHGRRFFCFISLLSCHSIGRNN
jgi:hypothetical protein